MHTKALPSIAQIPALPLQLRSIRRKQSLSSEYFRDIEKVNHMIYHILPPETWKTAQSNHGYTPQAFPEDGFIHCSDLYQVEKTANTIFHEASDLLVLEIDPQRTGIRLVYENLEGGQMTFPHL